MRRVVPLDQYFWGDRRDVLRGSLCRGEDHVALSKRERREGWDRKGPPRAVLTQIEEIAKDAGSRLVRKRQHDGIAGPQTPSTTFTGATLSGAHPTFSFPPDGMGTVSYQWQANGSNIDVYANNKKIDSVNDSTYTQGQIGVFESDLHGNGTTEVVFSNAKVWT